MSNKIRLTESELIKLITRVLNEQTAPTNPVQPQNQTGNDRISNIASNLRTLKNVNKPTWVIVSQNPKLNGMSWSDYLRIYKITKSEVSQARQLLNKLGSSPVTDNKSQIAQLNKNSQQPTKSVAKAAPKTAQPQKTNVQSTTGTTANLSGTTQA